MGGTTTHTAVPTVSALTMPRAKASEVQKLHRLKRPAIHVFEEVIKIAFALQPGDFEIHVIEKEIDEAFKDLMTLQSKIIAEDEAAGEIDDEILTHRRAYREAMAHVRSLARPEVRVGPSPSPSEESAPEISLPALRLQIFSGEVENGNSFANLLSALQARPRLTGSRKAQYLQSALKGTAAEFLQGIPIESGNFDEAWSLLEERYNHPLEVITRLIGKIAEYPRVSSQTALQGLLDAIQKNLRLLKSLWKDGTPS